MSNPSSSHSDDGNITHKQQSDASRKALLARPSEGIELGANSEETDTRRAKISARDLLTALSRMRISITELKFNGKGFQAGGTYGNVAVATLTRTDRNGKELGEVAVKKLRFMIAGDMTEEKFLRVFANELHILVKLSHPNIVKIIGFVEDIDNRIAWLVFPWEANGNLREFLRSGEWEIPERVSLIQDVALGLEYLHTRRPPICHGDLKSLNILVNSSNLAVITDFGSARILRDVRGQRSGQPPQPEMSSSDNSPKSYNCPEFNVVASATTLTLTRPACSFRWAPPEVLNGAPPDLSSDIWAIGWIAWEAITDCYPFHELEEETAVIMKVVEGQLPQVYGHDRFSEIGRLCKMMLKCWKPERKDRPSATECRTALEWIPSAVPLAKTSENSGIHSAGLLHRTGELYQMTNKQAEALELFEKGLTIARSTRNMPWMGWLLTSMAGIHAVQSRFDKAEEFYTQALEIFTRIAYEIGRATALMGLGDVRRRSDKTEAAEELYIQALDIFINVGHGFGQANALLSLGSLQSDRSKNAEAEQCYFQALKIFDGRVALSGFGATHFARAEYAEAEEWYIQAREIYKSVGEGLFRAKALHDLGDVYLAQDQYNEAEETFTQALEISTDFENSLGQANALRGLGEAHQGRGDYAKAEESLSRALEIFTKTGKVSRKANVLRLRGFVNLARGKYIEALDSFDQALAIFTSLRDDSGIANVSRGLGLTYQAQSNYVKAEDFYIQALEVLTRLGDCKGQATILHDLAIASLNQSEYIEAEEFNTKALEIFRGVGDDEGQAVAFCWLGEVQMAQSRHTEAGESYSQALKTFTSIEDDESQVASSLNLAKIRLLQARYAEAKALIDEAVKVSDRRSLEWGLEGSRGLLEEILQAEGSPAQSQLLPLAPSETGI